jgi:hypothetical protein
MTQTLYAHINVIKKEKKNLLPDPGKKAPSPLYNEGKLSKRKRKT